MTNTFFVVSKVFHESPRNYLRNRVISFYRSKAYRVDPKGHDLPEEKLETFTDGLVKALNNTNDIPFSVALYYSLETSKDDSQLDKHGQLLLNEVNDCCPLIDGEVIEEDSFAYLEQPWLDFSEKTAVLKRITNLSESYYLFKHYEFDSASQSFKENPIVEHETGVKVGRVSSVEDAFGAVAKEISEGMLGLLPSPLNSIGTTLISAIWPSSSSATISWEQVYLALQTIVRNELASQEVKRASGVLDGYISFLNTEYAALKANKKTKKQELIAELSVYDVKFYTEIVNVFMASEKTEPDFAAAALANFMSGACIHLNLNQERALQDPKYKKPNKSAYAETIKNLLNTSYIEYANTTAPVVKDLRMKQISTVQSKTDTTCNSAGCFTSTHYYFTDSNVDYRSSNSENESRVQEERLKYYSEIEAEMDDLLQKEVYDVVKNWEQLEKKPVPDNFA